MEIRLDCISEPEVLNTVWFSTLIKFLVYQQPSSQCMFNVLQTPRLGCQHIVAVTVDCSMNIQCSAHFVYELSIGLATGEIKEEHSYGRSQFLPCSQQSGLHMYEP